MVVRARVSGLREVSSPKDKVQRGAHDLPAQMTRKRCGLLAADQTISWACSQVLLQSPPPYSTSTLAGEPTEM